MEPKPAKPKNQSRSLSCLLQGDKRLRLKSAGAAGSGGVTPQEMGRKVASANMRTKVLDEKTGECEHIVSVFNVVDYGLDRILPGFFAKSLAAKLPKGVWCHDWSTPVAKTLEAKELMPGDELLPEEIREFGGLYVKAQYNMDTQRGREAFSDVAGGFMDEFSIGFTVEKEAKDAKTGVNNLIEGWLFEWSPVLWGMNPLTRHVSAKALPSSAQAPATKDLAQLTKDAQAAWETLRTKSMDDYLPRAMTWGAMSRAVDCLWSELYDAVWGWGEYRDTDISTRAQMLTVCLDTFSTMVVGGFTALMTALEQIDAAEDATESDLTDDSLDDEDELTLKGAALKRHVTLSLLTSMPEAMQEKALAQFTAAGKKALGESLQSALVKKAALADPAPLQDDADASHDTPAADDRLGAIGEDAERLKALALMDAALALTAGVESLANP